MEPRHQGLAINRAAWGCIGRGDILENDPLPLFIKTAQEPDLLLAERAGAVVKDDEDGTIGHTS